ncbi:hypothetical protein E2C01_001756 [Portunus trituberculatus]|uniref:Uncharacterized protein n=1 Tax=Portunus trituberculatus TaxID=210409 RepID=A0A5B7CNA7_PORTR|nr:hypothetical protein [Portunus trituberculatus]
MDCGTGTSMAARHRGCRQRSWVIQALSEVSVVFLSDTGIDCLTYVCGKVTSVQQLLHDLYFRR